MGSKFSHSARCSQDVRYEKGRKAPSTSEEKTGISSENLSSKSEVNLKNIHPVVDFEPMESFQYLKRSELTGSLSEYSIRLSSPSLNSQDLSSPSPYAADTMTAINDLLSLCESGNGPTLSYLLDNHDVLNEVINEYHECHVGDRQMNITPLMLAAACGHPHIVEEFLVVPSVQLNLKSGDIYGQTAVHIAVSLGQLKCVQALAASPNVDINAVDTLQMTPLHVATYGRFDEAIELLLERNDVDCSLQDSNGNNIFHIGALSNNVSAIKSILKHASMIDFCEIYRYGDHSPSEDLSHLRRPDMGNTLRQLTEVPRTLQTN
jgi:Ankyrin repeats (3 copies)